MQIVECYSAALTCLCIQSKNQRQFYSDWGLDFMFMLNMKNDLLSFMGVCEQHLPAPNSTYQVYDVLQFHVWNWKYIIWEKKIFELKQWVR